MLLAADRKLAREPMRGPVDRGGRVAAAEARSRPARARPLPSASAMVTDGAFASMSILASRAARRASSRVRAATANSACPWNRISSSANSGSSAKTGAMSFLPGISAAVRTATTPGRAAHRARDPGSSACRTLGRPCRPRYAACPRARRCRRHRPPSPARAGGRNRGAAACGRPRWGAASSADVIRRHGAFQSGSARRAPEISISAFSRRLAATAMR